MTTTLTSEFDDLNDELALALGRAIWAFSRIERITFAFLADLSDERLDILMGDQSFNARIKLARQLVQRINGIDNEKSQALQLLQEAEALARTRNVLAHNPWRISIDFEQRDFRTEIQHLSQPNRSFDRTSVQKFTKDAQALAEALETALRALSRL